MFLMLIFHNISRKNVCTTIFKCCVCKYTCITVNLSRLVSRVIEMGFCAIYGNNIEIQALHYLLIRSEKAVGSNQLPRLFFLLFS